jgi:hypothetical protein
MMKVKKGNCCSQIFPNVHPGSSNISKDFGSKYENVRDNKI